MKSLLQSTVAGILAVGISAVAAVADPIKIGVTLPLTGPASVVGVPVQQTLELLTKQQNEKGGLLGEKVQLVTYDDQGDPAKVRTFITRLIESDNVDLIIGPVGGGPAFAAISIVEQSGIPMIALSGSRALIDPVKRWVFKTPHSDYLNCESILGDMKSRGLTKIALIADTGGFGVSMSKSCHEVATKIGIEIVTEQSYGPADVDMTVQLTKIRNTRGVQAVLNCGTMPGPTVVTRNYAGLGITLPLYQSFAVAGRDFIDLTGKAAEGVRMSAPRSAMALEDLVPNDPQTELLVKYHAELKTAYGREWVSPTDSDAYDAFVLAVDAIARAGSVDKEAVREAIEKTSGLIGTKGTYNLSPKDHNGLTVGTLVMMEAREGRWRLIR